VRGEEIMSGKTLSAFAVPAPAARTALVEDAAP
jgi:hypothetical protein